MRQKLWKLLVVLETLMHLKIGDWPDGGMKRRVLTATKLEQPYGGYSRKRQSLHIRIFRHFSGPGDIWCWKLLALFFAALATVSSSKYIIYIHWMKLNFWWHGWFGQRTSYFLWISEMKIKQTNVQCYSISMCVLRCLKCPCHQHLGSVSLRKLSKYEDRAWLIMNVTNEWDSSKCNKAELWPRATTVNARFIPKLAREPHNQQPPARLKLN